jgi:predicted transcriptional regulator
MYINYWHRVHSDGRISAVKLIKHQGEILYEAEKVNFDDLGPACYMEKERVLGPVRIVTREYLRGAFG